jgi:hypothetical protein
MVVTKVLEGKLEVKHCGLECFGGIRPRNMGIISHTRYSRILTFEVYEGIFLYY